MLVPGKHQAAVEQLTSTGSMSPEQRKAAHHGYLIAHDADAAGSNVVAGLLQEAQRRQEGVTVGKHGSHQQMRQLAADSVVPGTSPTAVLVNLPGSERNKTAVRRIHDELFEGARASVLVRRRENAGPELNKVYRALLKSYKDNPDLGVRRNAKSKRGLPSTLVPTIDDIIFLLSDEKFYVAKTTQKDFQEHMAKQMQWLIEQLGQVKEREETWEEQYKLLLIEYATAEEAMHSAVTRQEQAETYLNDSVRALNDERAANFITVKELNSQIHHLREKVFTLLEEKAGLTAEIKAALMAVDSDNVSIGGKTPSGMTLRVDGASPSLGNSMRRTRSNRKRDGSFSARSDMLDATTRSGFGESIRSRRSEDNEDMTGDELVAMNLEPHEEREKLLRLLGRTRSERDEARYECSVLKDKLSLSEQDVKTVHQQCEQLQRTQTMEVDNMKRMLTQVRDTHLQQLQSHEIDNSSMRSQLVVYERSIKGLQRQLRESAARMLTLQDTLLSGPSVQALLYDAASTEDADEAKGIISELNQQLSTFAMRISQEQDVFDALNKEADGSVDGEHSLADAKAQELLANALIRTKEATKSLAASPQIQEKRHRRTSLLPQSLSGSSGYARGAYTEIGINTEPVGVIEAPEELIPKRRTPSGKRIVGGGVSISKPSSSPREGSTSISPSSMKGWQGIGHQASNDGGASSGAAGSSTRALPPIMNGRAGGAGEDPSASTASHSAPARAASSHALSRSGKTGSLKKGASGKGRKGNKRSATPAATASSPKGASSPHANPLEMADSIHGASSVFNATNASEVSELRSALQTLQARQEEDMQLAEELDSAKKELGTLKSTLHEKTISLEQFESDNRELKARLKDFEKIGTQLDATERAKLLKLQNQLNAEKEKGMKLTDKCNQQFLATASMQEKVDKQRVAHNNEVDRLQLLLGDLQYEVRMLSKGEQRIQFINKEKNFAETCERTLRCILSAQSSISCPSCFNVVTNPIVLFPCATIVCEMCFIKAQAERKLVLPPEVEAAALQLQSHRKKVEHFQRHVSIAGPPPKLGDGYLVPESAKWNPEVFRPLYCEECDQECVIGFVRCSRLAEASKKFIHLENSISEIKEMTMETLAHDTEEAMEAADLAAGRTKREKGALKLTLADTSKDSRIEGPVDLEKDMEDAPPAATSPQQVLAELPPTPSPSPGKPPKAESTLEAINKLSESSVKERQRRRSSLDGSTGIAGSRQQRRSSSSTGLASPTSPGPSVIPDPATTSPSASKIKRALSTKHSVVFSEPPLQQK